MTTITAPKFESLAQLLAAAQVALPGFNMGLGSPRQISGGASEEESILVAQLPGNPLGTAQAVGVDLASGQIESCGEQDAASDLWTWLIGQGFKAVAV